MKILFPVNLSFLWKIIAVKKGIAPQVEFFFWHTSPSLMWHILQGNN